MNIKFLSILVGAVVFAATAALAGPPKSESKMFALEAFEHVNIDQIPVYEKMGLLIDKQVNETEPGMLVHALTKVSQDENEAVYRWLEVFESPEALQAHLDNPLVKVHIEKLTSGVLSGKSDIVIYASWDDKQIAYWTDVFSGTNFTYAPLETGFFVSR